jgi:cytochrome P450
MVYDDADVRAVLSGPDGAPAAAWWPAGTAELVGPASLNVLAQPRQAQVKAAFSRAFSERAVAGYLPAVLRAAAAVLDAWVDATTAAAASAAPGESGGGGGGGAAAGALAEAAATGQALRLCEVLASATFHAALLGESGGSSSGGGRGAEGEAAGLVADVAARAALAGVLAGGFVPPMLELPFTAFGRARRARGELAAQYAAGLSAARARQAQARRGDGGGGSSNEAPAAAIDALAAAAGLTDAEAVDGVVACLFGNAGAGPTMVKLFQYVDAAGRGGAGDDSSSGSGGGSWWARLREEQRGVVAARGPALDAAALEAMPLADAVVREALRITPVVPAIFRM